MRLRCVLGAMVIKTGQCEPVTGHSRTAVASRTGSLVARIMHSSEFSAADRIVASCRSTRPVTRSWRRRTARMRRSGSTTLGATRSVWRSCRARWGSARVAKAGVPVSRS